MRHLIASVDQISKGDILFGKLRPALNKVAYAQCDGICSTDIIVLRPKDANVISKYYSILLRNKEFNNLVLNGIDGGQLPRVDTQYLMKLPIQKVDIIEQQKILSEIESIEQIIEPNERLIEIFLSKISKKIQAVWGE